VSTGEEPAHADVLPGRPPARDGADDDPEILTAAEAARFLRCDVKTLRAAVRLGRVPAIALTDSDFRFSRTALIQFAVENWKCGRASPARKSG
jgi:hypothetical protein